MTCIEKFTFTRSFADLAVAGGGSEPPAAAAPPAVYGEDDLAGARAEARAEGIAEGRDQAFAEAHGALEHRLAEALERVAERLERDLAERADIARDADRGALALAAAGLRKALPALHRRFAVAEIEAMVAELAAKMVDAPALTVSVHPAVAGEVAKRMAAATAARGLAERTTVAADAGLAEGDCTVAWAGGGGERRLAALLAGIDEIVAALTGAGTLTGAPARPVDAQGSGSMEHNG